MQKFSQRVAPVVGMEGVEMPAAKTGEDKSNLDGILKDKNAGKVTEQMGDTPKKVYTDDDAVKGWSRIAREAINNLHDRLNFGTSTRKEAIEEAAGEEAEPKIPDPKKKKGFASMAGNE